jgi:hypothetical protein
MAKRENAPRNAAHSDINALDWAHITSDLNDDGFAKLGCLLEPDACRMLASRYEEPRTFRSRIEMARYNFGRGEYKYFAHPLPAPVSDLRAALYGPLSIIANDWASCLGESRRYPDKLEDYLATCRAAGQCRPTPLLLRYRAGDYNCLHQDLYGDEVFPIQVVVQLSRPGEDFTGGEFVIVEQRPRMQSRASVILLSQGEALAFAVNNRPRRGTRGYHRAKLRHGVSRVQSGDRYTLGIIFHDAK